MTVNATRVAARHIGRPLLIAPDAAAYWLDRVQAIDPNFGARPGRIGALVRRLAGRVTAYDDDAPREEVPFGQLGAYLPLYIGEPDDVGFCWTLKDGIALINCDTPLLARGERFCGSVWHGYDTLLAALREASADERVKGIFFRADSPGGVVDGGLSVLAEWMRANRAAAGGKPIHVYADMACSAMYWIAAQADRIVAPGVGVVGSIGAVVLHEDWSAALEKAGVKITAIQFGAKKTDGAWFNALSPRASADLQAEIDQCGRNFTADVFAGRAALTIEKQLATEAGVYLGSHDDPERSALSLGLVDGVMGEEAAFAALASEVSGAAPVSINTRAQAAPARTQSKESKMAEPAQQKQAAIPAASKNDPIKPAAEVPAEETGDEDETDPDKKKPEDEPEPEAVKIAKSAEAKANPALATTAIANGLTLAQFQAMASAAPRKGSLAAAMEGAPRLGNDAAGGAKAVKSLDPRAIYDRRKAGARKAG